MKKCYNQLDNNSEQEIVTMAKIRMKLAKPGRRFGAACIDTAVPFILYIILMIAASKRNSFSYNYGYGYGYGYGYYEQSSGPSAAVIAIAVFLLLAYFVVECIFYAKAASIGKMLLGLRVVSSFDGKPLGFWRMLYREWIVKQASNVLLLGYIWILVDDRHRAWHDKIMDTYVVDMKASGLTGVQNAPAPASAAAPPADGAAANAPASAPAAAPAAPAPEANPAPATSPVSAAPATPAASAAPEPAAAPAMPQKPTIRLDVEETAPAAVKADMSMKKDELLEAAAKLGVSVDDRATKTEIIEAIRKASE